MHRVALVDDETAHASFYVDAIRAKGYRCVHFRSPASAITALRSGQHFDCFVTDLMMPPRGAFSFEETQGGLLSGLLLTLRIRELHSRTPIIVFSNINIDGIVGQVESALTNVHNVIFVSKAEFVPARLADGIAALLETGAPIAQRATWLEGLLSALILKPSLFGVGIDLKKITPEWWWSRE